MSRAPSPHGPRIEIRYCTQCRWLLRAAWLAQELLVTFEAEIGELALVPGSGGVFEVRADGALLWSRAERGRFPELKELKQLLRDRIAPGRTLGHSEGRRAEVARGRLRRIVSGGQTGADRAALDAARTLGLETGGWVPKGRVAEDGIVPQRYEGLREADAAEPAVRTLRNVRDSDATLVVSHGAPAGGSKLSLDEARRLGRPFLHLDLAGVGSDAGAATLARWLHEVDPETLNVAGPRASEDPRIADAVMRLLREALGGERGAP